MNCYWILELFRQWFIFALYWYIYDSKQTYLLEIEIYEKFTNEKKSYFAIQRCLLWKKNVQLSLESNKGHTWLITISTFLRSYSVTHMFNLLHFRRQLLDVKVKIDYSTNDYCLLCLSFIRSGQIHWLNYLLVWLIYTTYFL